jgi:hypothetical protein
LKLFIYPVHLKIPVSRGRLYRFLFCDFAE